MRLHSAVAAASGALMLVLAVPGSASAATGQFRYSYKTADGYDAVGFFNNPESGRCIDIKGAGSDGTSAAYAIRQVMSQASARSAGYRLILQSYPSPVPSSARVRYGEGGGGKVTERTLVGGCPLWNADFDLMHDTLAPAIDAMLRRVATATGAEFLSMLGAVEGHALCEQGTSQAGPLDDAANLGDTMEWVRYGTAGAKISQGHQQEAMHPNAFGQQALGRCLLALYRNPGTQPCNAGTPRSQT